MKIYFYGSSDDCIEVECGETCDVSDEYNAYDCPGWLEVKTPSGDGLMVFAHYAPNGFPDGTWVLGVTLLAEDHPLPDWPISYATAENGYSPVLIIDAPEDVIVSEREKEGARW
ncbi:MAG: hypothetical protein PHS57_06200 [Alphaproteobacteria bacterium]|nr:hypothetical protein [Alphaproteobacteria bacterium]